MVVTPVIGSVVENPSTSTLTENGWPTTVVDELMVNDIVGVNGSTLAATFTPPVNDAPTLNAHAVPVVRGGALGTTVSALLAAAGAHDVDVPAVFGLAVKATAGAGWQYSTDGGATWLDLGVVAVEGAEVELLRALDEVAPDEEAVYKVCGDQMFDHGEVGEVPRDGQQLAGRFLVGVGKGVGLLGRRRRSGRPAG